MRMLPSISGRGCVRDLEAVGFYVKRQKGSHIVLRRDEPFAQVVVPDHRQLDRGLCGASSDMPDWALMIS
jgi:predicted RNA binding protein YcfA (HicA-like mRNA interferase family)